MAFDDHSCIVRLRNVGRRGSDGKATATTMKLVIVESPYAGDVERNLEYVRAAMRDCLKRGEAPYASHALYTQPGVLDDRVPEERLLGIEAGFAWRTRAELTAFYTDLGWSKGMQKGLDDCVARRHPIQIRRLGGIWVTEGVREFDETPGV